MNEQEKENAKAYLEKTKQDAMKFYTEACTEAERWALIINDCHQRRYMLINESETQY